MDIQKTAKLLTETSNNRKILVLFGKTFLIAIIFIAVGFTLDIVSYGFTAGEAVQRVLDNIWKPFAFAFAVAVFFNPQKNKA